MRNTWRGDCVWKSLSLMWCPGIQCHGHPAQHSLFQAVPQARFPPVSIWKQMLWWDQTWYLQDAVRRTRAMSPSKSATVGRDERSPTVTTSWAEHLSFSYAWKELISTLFDSCCDSLGRNSVLYPSLEQAEKRKFEKEKQ